MVKKTDFNSKITELEAETPIITCLATNSELTVVEKKIPDVSTLVTQKISDIEKKIIDHDDDKYMTTPEFNTLAADVFNARLKQANLITKRDLDTEFKKIMTELLKIKVNTCLLKIN